MQHAARMLHLVSCCMYFADMHVHRAASAPRLLVQYSSGARAALGSHAMRTCAPRTMRCMCRWMLAILLLMNPTHGAMPDSHKMKDMAQHIVRALRAVGHLSTSNIASHMKYVL
jgi:hypothetical protein